MQTVDVNANALKSSYLVAQRVAKCGQPNTIAECYLHGENRFRGKGSFKIKNNSFSNDTVQRRIAVISIDLMEQVVERINDSSTFAI